MPSARLCCWAGASETSPFLRVQQPCQSELCSQATGPQTARRPRAHGGRPRPFPPGPTGAIWEVTPTWVKQLLLICSESATQTDEVSVATFLPQRVWELGASQGRLGT